MLYHIRWYLAFRLEDEKKKKMKYVYVKKMLKWLKSKIKSGKERCVAERISYFCLARNLIRPLGSTHIFTQSGWLILFIPDHLSGQHQIGEIRQNTFSSSKLLRSGQTSYCLFFNSSSNLTPPWGKPSNLWTSWVYSLRPRVPSWILIRWIQYATHRNNF